MTVSFATFHVFGRSKMISNWCRYLIVTSLLLTGVNTLFSQSPPYADYCQRLEQEIQGKKHGFLAGNLAYYVGGFHASWDLKEHETIGLTHPFSHDLRSRGVGLVESQGANENNTGRGNDFSGWEFYKDTRVLYGSVFVGGKLHRYPVPSKMYWRPDRMICEYKIDGVELREEKFIAANDVACTTITSSVPVKLRFDGQSFFGRHSLTSSATIKYEAKHNAIHIMEGGTTRCQPEVDRSMKVGPIMYEGMSTVLAASRNIAKSHRFVKGDQGQMQYDFEVPCDRKGITLVWSMHDEKDQAINAAMATLRTPESSMSAKTREMNRQLNREVPYFRCSDRRFEDIYYFLWSLYLMYYIDVGRGMEIDPHTQTAVNNFLGMHRYDATFQIKVGAWSNHKSQLAYGNVLTWKRLFTNGYFRKLPNGEVALADNKGTEWHSGVYGNELSEHVLGAWQIYQHTGDLDFLKECYQGYFREVFREKITPFYSNHFEVAEKLIAMAVLTGHSNDVKRWQQLVPVDRDEIQHWFEQRWQVNGIEDYFAGPANGMLMTTGFWHMRSRHFPREYAVKMTNAWALDKEIGFHGEIFPLAMSRQSMKAFHSNVDHSFGSTPDTAYFMLSGMFRQRLGDPAWRLTLQHLSRYNFNSRWKIPVAPEAYTRSGKLFGDQYSNFNAGKLLLFLEGLAGLEYSIPDRRLVVHDTMPKTWKWMEFRIPIRMPGEKETYWPKIRFERSSNDMGITKSIQVSDSPLQIRIEPWLEGKRIIEIDSSAAQEMMVEFPQYRRFEFAENASSAVLKVRLKSTELEK